MHFVLSVGGDGRSLARAAPLRWLAACLLVAVIGGCDSLPHDGPSMDAVRKDAAAPGSRYSLVELDARSSAIVGAAPGRPLASLSPVSSNARIDLIGVGDGLAVTIYERGLGALFSSGVGVTGEVHSATNTLPTLWVDGAGDIALPFGGRVRVAELTTAQAERAIEAALRGKAVQPQVVVNIAQNVSSSVTVMGEVRNPGRYVLADGADRLLDVVAQAAGPTKASDDIRVEVARGPATASISMAQLLRDDASNVRLAPRDQVRLVYHPRKFSIFGALSRTAEYAIEDERLTLAGALGRAGGLDAATANATSVMLFRFERPEVAAALGVTAPPSPKGVPIVYHLNLRNPEGLFVANQFEVEPDDLIYVPRSGLVEAKQFIDVIVAASSVAYNARVTSVLP
jgi:polysaccharide export outer membrane protein